MTVAQQLAQARRRARLTQEQAGARLGVDRSTLSLYEAGRRQVPPEVLVAAARLYRAPELLLSLDRSPLRGVALSGDPVEAAAWLREELREAEAALERAESALRRGLPCEREDDQLYDLYSALDSYFCARARSGLDLEALARRHRRKISDRYGGRAQEVAA